MDAPLAVVGDDDEGGAVELAGGAHGIDHLLHAVVEEGDGVAPRVVAEAGGVLDAVQRKQMQQQQVGMMPADDVDRRAGVDSIAPRLRRLPEMHQLVTAEHALAQQILFDGASGIGTLGKLPVDACCVLDGDPVHLRRGEAGCMSGIVDSGHRDQPRLRQPHLDAGCGGAALVDHQPVDHQVVPAGIHAGDHRGVVGPGDGGVDRLHRHRIRTLPHQRLQGGRRQRWLVQAGRAERIQADDYDLRMMRRGRCRQHCPRKRHAAPQQHGQGEPLSKPFYRRMLHLVTSIRSSRSGHLDASRSIQAARSKPLALIGSIPIGLHWRNVSSSGCARPAARRRPGLQPLQTPRWPAGHSWRGPAGRWAADSIPGSPRFAAATRCGNGCAPAAP